MTGRALDLVADAVRTDHDDIVRISTARFIDSTSGRSTSVSLAAGPSHPALVVASRKNFDERLLAVAVSAGAELLPTRAVDLRREEAGRRPRFVIHTAAGECVRADVVIGADGVNSFVRKRVARPFARHQLSIATGFFAHGATNDEIVIELTSHPAGYVWSFPRADHLAIGICAQADCGVAATSMRDRVRQWIDRGGVGRGASLEPYTWPIPSLCAADFASLETAGPAWFLVGDAAGLVDPITREGIFFALQSGAFAADALLSGGRVQQRFTERVRFEITSDLERAARLKAGFFDPRFAPLMMDAVAASGAIRAVLADLIAGTQSYRTLKWRLVKTFELRLALKMLSASAARRRGYRPK